MTPAEQTGQQRDELLARIGRDRQAMALSLHRLGAPFRTVEQLRSQISELTRYLPLLLASMLLLWWLRRRSQAPLSRPMMGPMTGAVSAPPAMAAGVGRWSYWSGLIQQIVEGWRLALQLRELLRLQAGLPAASRPPAIAPDRVGSPASRRGPL